jgi:1-aminocyclopropane-1-carboxylate deaminase
MTWQPAPAPLQRLTLPGGTIHVQRDDLIHPVISGNKWRKLTGWLQRAQAENKSTLLTYGGAWSNHLLATACLAQATGLHSIGILRGDEPMDNPHLTAALGYGMKICQVPRTLYRDKAASLVHIKAFPELSGTDWSRVLVIPEGGGGPEGFIGFQDLIASWQEQAYHPTAILHASATATTAVGLALALTKAGLTTKILAVPVLHNLPEQQALAAAHSVTDRIQWITGHESTGYAKTTTTLRTFCQDFTTRHHLPCEPIYTGKALHALSHLLETQQLAPEGLIFLHTGGLFGTPPHSHPSSPSSHPSRPPPPE